MKRNTILTIIFICLCAITLYDALLEQNQLEGNSEPAIEIEEYEMQRKTEVFETVFQHLDGNTMIYYICETTYFNASQEKVSGLDTVAFYSIFPVDAARLQKELTIVDYPAAYYQQGARSYLCCTVSPEISLVLEYNPESISDEEAYKVIHSVFEAPNS